ncbi:MmcQ/YjbR family DNA-binding protein [Pseudonocardia sp.]|uniref:MmcQ/YjbR family DNA-binding protein n=1 Tax=Pseudonocardia sp. TaxID=60912 RepID=UPI003D15039F
MATAMDRLVDLVARLPETQRVDVVEWGDHPTFRVRDKTFVFSSADATSMTVKLAHDEAEAVVATRDGATPAGYGLGRHGWVNIVVPAAPTDEEWAEIAEWVATSYRMVAPKRLARLLDEPPA